MNEYQENTILRMLDDLKRELREDGYQFNHPTMVLLDECRDAVRAGVDVDDKLDGLRYNIDVVLDSKKQLVEHMVNTEKDIEQKKIRFLNEQKKAIVLDMIERYKKQNGLNDDGLEW